MSNWLGLCNHQRHIDDGGNSLPECWNCETECLEARLCRCCLASKVERLTVALAERDLSTPTVDRAEFNDDGTIDEVVIGPWLHVEEMHRTKRYRDWHVQIGDANLAVRATAKRCTVTVVEAGWSARDE